MVGPNKRFSFPFFQHRQQKKELGNQERSVKIIKMQLSSSDRRFGFSVMGGTDEGFRPIIDDIWKGCDALVPIMGHNPDLDVRKMKCLLTGIYIMKVDLSGFVLFLTEDHEGKMKLFGTPSEKSDLEMEDEILEVNGKSVEDCTHAEVISIIHRCIKTRSICLKIKRKKNQAESPEAEVKKFHKAYIVSNNNETHKQLETFANNKNVSAVDMTKVYFDERTESNQTSDAVTTSDTVINVSSMPVNTRCDNHIVNGQTDNGQFEMPKMNGFMEKEIPRKGKGKKDKHKRHSNIETGVIDSNGNHGLSNHESGSQSYHNSLNRSKDKIHDGYDSLPSLGSYTHSSFDIDDTGPHREMAIDCPDNFIAKAKSPPRYPPPQPESHSLASVESSPEKSSIKSKDSSIKSKDSGQHEMEGYSIETNQTPHLRDDQIERLRRHQEEIKKRREEENRIQKEQEFLRKSLRGSKKLQALEDNRPPAGVVNTAFDGTVEEDAADGQPGANRPESEKQIYMKKNIKIEDLFSSLHHIQSRLNTPENKDQLTFLKKLFHNSQFQEAVKIHNKVIDVTTRSPSPKPVCSNASQIVDELASESQHSSSPQMKELSNILGKCHLKVLLKGHDELAAKQSQPVVGLLDDDLYDQTPSQYFGDDSVKIVHLNKTNEPLGATVKNEGESVLIGRIVKGGIADKSGLLHEGDEILEINGIDMVGKNINDVSEMLANMTGTITFMIVPNVEVEQSSPRNQTATLGCLYIQPRLDLKPLQCHIQYRHHGWVKIQTHVKALFNYEPEEDQYIPCRELGISFLKGEILHIINSRDNNWWQAYRQGEEEEQTLAGLIPSRSFQEQREALRQSIASETLENQKKGKSCACGKKDKKKKKKALYNAAQTDENEDILTYEDVDLYYPQPNRKRPIVLIGPPHVGRQELRERLMEYDMDRFAAAIPHTSRPKTDEEVHGREYYFISKSVFEADILGCKFVEHGEFQKSLYGTSISAVKSVISQGKICVLTLNAESLRALKDSDLKPYIVFVYPQNFEKLRLIRQSLGNDQITDEDLKETIEKGREMEDKYGHYFDFILVVSELDKAFDELLAEINRIEVEPQWVPVEWLNS